MEANSKGGAIGSLLSAAAATGGNLVEKALAIDDALGQWEDQVHSAHPHSSIISHAAGPRHRGCLADTALCRAVQVEAKVTAKAQEKAQDIISLVGAGDVGAKPTPPSGILLPCCAAADGAEGGAGADEDELSLPVEEQLSRQRRKGRDLKSQLELAQSKTRAAEAKRDELEAAVVKAKDDIAARDHTLQELDGKLSEYAELIPAWERKMEEERREEDILRKQEQAAAAARIQALADEQVAAVRQELERERDGRAGLEFQLSQAFEAKARAKEQSVELVRPTPPVSRSRGGAHPLS